MHHLPGLELLMGSFTTTWLFPLCLDSVGQCSIDEGMIWVRVTLPPGLSLLPDAGCTEKSLIP